jgi:hypothetical protein
MPLQPVAHLFVLVGRVVVHNQMELQVCGRFPADLFQKAPPLDMGVARLGPRQDFAAFTPLGFRPHFTRRPSITAGKGE